MSVWNENLLGAAGSLIGGVLQAPGNALSQLVTGRPMFGAGSHVEGLINNYTGARDQANLEESWRREDTAIQRMVADAEAANINPMALVGSGMGAPTGAAPSTQGRQSGVQDALSVAQFDRQLKMMDAQIESVHAATELSRAKAATEYTTKDLRDQEWAFLNEFNPERLEQLRSQIKGQDLANVGRELDNELALKGLELRDVEIARALLGERLDELRITGQERDNVLKLVALSTGKAELQALRHNLALAEANGWPVGSWNSFQVIADAIKEAVGAVLGWRGIPTTDEIVEKLQSVGEDALSVFTGDVDEDDPKLLQLLERVVGFVPPVFVVRKIIDAVRLGRERAAERSSANEERLEAEARFRQEGM